MKLTIAQVRALKAELGCGTHATFRAAWRALTDEQRADTMRKAFP